MPERYVVWTSARRRMRSFAIGAIPLVLFVVLAGGGAYLGAKDAFGRGFALVGIGMIALFLLVYVYVTTGRRRQEVVVSAAGVQLDEASMSWRSIERVVLGPAGVGVRLTAQAPLPDGVGGVVHDPRRPDDLHVWHGFRGQRVDLDQLAATARAYAPAGVPVLSGTGPGERPRPGRERLETVATVTDVRLRTGRAYVRTTTSEHNRAKPHPVVRFALPDGRQVIAESATPGQGEPGRRVVVSYDTVDPTDVRVSGDPPDARWVRTW